MSSEISSNGKVFYYFPSSCWIKNISIVYGGIKKRMNAVISLNLREERFSDFVSGREFGESEIKNENLLNSKFSAKDKFNYKK